MALEVEQLARVQAVVCVKRSAIVGEAEVMEQNVQGRVTRRDLVTELAMEGKEKGQ